MSNFLQRAILIPLSLFVMSSTASAVEGTAQEFLDKYEHAAVTERQTLLASRGRTPLTKLMASLASTALPVGFFISSRRS